MRTALIDADILRYEIGHSGEYTNEDGEEIVREFDFVAELLDHKIAIIAEETEADKVVLYLTNDSRTSRVWNRWRKTHKMDPIELKPNFRDAIATVKAYKSTRGKDKPLHYNNLTAYMLDQYEFVIGNGIEADDLMAMHQTKDTIICSRDKDLRQVAGWHYSWECGKQGAIGPIEFDKKGFIEDRGGKVFGGGEMFFAYQLLIGDPVDTIPGCPKIGHVKAVKILDECNNRKEVYQAVLDCYTKVYGEDAINMINEQGQLLWLLRHDGDVWEFPYGG